MNTFTFIYICVQCVIGVLIFRFIFRINGWQTHTNTAASILTIFGVFGTFLGIFIGLWVFDIENIERSIPGLLEGLKLAFLTSLVGIALALSIKSIALFQTTVDTSGEVIERLSTTLSETLQNVETSGEINLRTQLVALNTTIETIGRDSITILNGIKSDLLTIQTSLTDGQNETKTHLRELSTTLSEKHDTLTNLQEEEGKQTREELTNIQIALTNGQTDIGFQLENLRTSFADKQDTLILQFQEFSKNVAESVAKLATDELIDALKSVIENFNANITEQFGENFKQLNQAVERTVEWQEQYRQQLNELADEFRLASQSIEDSRRSVESIAESTNEIAVRSESIVTCTEKFDPILHTLNDQLEAFSELKQNAINAFPLIEKQLTELTAGFSDAVQTAIDNSHDSMKQQHSALTEQSELLKSTIANASNELTESTTRFSDSVDISINQAQESMNLQREALSNRLSEIEDLIGTVTQQVQNTINTSQASMDSQRQELTHLSQQVQGNIKEIERSLEAELTGALQNLSGHLTSLSEKFVEDYTPLTEELYRLVNLARSGPFQDNPRI